MNSWTHVREALVFSVLAAASANASAGEPGHMSRSSISISVTVPPRLHVQLVGDVKVQDLLSRGSLSQEVCVVTNSPESTYSVTLLGAETTIDASSHDSAAEAPVSVRWTEQGDRTQAIQMTQGKTASGFRASTSNSCQMNGIGRAKLVLHPNDQAVLALNRPTAPLTLLIAPD